jgi:small subunit ribosomal protein S17e
MGKKRAMSIRRLAERLIETHPDMFTEDFEENKKLVSEVVNFPSKAIRNKVAGYIRRLKMRKSKTPLPAPTAVTEPPRFSRRGRGRRRWR